MFSSVMQFCKRNAVLCIAFLAAAVTVFFVPPDAAYLQYPDFKTLTCLFCVLAVVCALKDQHFFTFLADAVVRRFKTLRRTILALMYITFLGSMLIANDMALLTFLPLGYFVLSNTGKERHMAFTFIMQNIAANLGGMLTPFGNPQNLYLYSYFHIPNGSFLRIMALPFLLSVCLITLCCVLFLPKEPITLTAPCPYKPEEKHTALYLALFALSIVIVFRTVPYYVGLIVIPAVLFFADRNALKKVDYPLLATFLCFFVFAGNMARLDAVSRLFSALMHKQTLLFSVLSCQLISNVPSAVLLSHFTENYTDLLRGVNIGGTGTLIASLASLITFRTYQKYQPGKTGSYIALFSAYNFVFLFLLTGFCILLA